jgi:hypothetical protein
MGSEMRVCGSGERKDSTAGTFDVKIRPFVAMVEG